ncbi:MAG: 50S ribosomal protein L7/L12 [Arsenophonus sp.]|nr:MAG: 50S ribosomal protein L7/L12 [Arsenophonus sp.]
MPLTKEEIINAVSKMSIMDITELIKLMEEKFGISSASHNLETTNVEKVEKKEEKTEFNIILSNMGSNKISTIKAIRTITGLGLKEAKDMVESAPVTIKESVNKEESEKIKKIIEEAGASVELQ